MKLFLAMSLLSVTLHISKYYHSPLGHESVGMGACTAVWISPNEVLTAGHCVQNSRGKQWIRTDNQHSYAATVIATDFTEDLALLAIPGARHKYVELSKRPIVPTERVFTVNSGEDNQGTYGEGVIENIVVIELVNSPVIMHSIAILHGASGSGLFDKNGRLVGINIIKQGGISYAVHLSTIKKFLSHAPHAKTH